MTSHAIGGDYPTTATYYAGEQPSDAALLLAHGAGASQHHKVRWSDRGPSGARRGTS